MAKTKPQPEAPAEYTVVARRYRPQQFADLIGQEHVAQALSNALHRNAAAAAIAGQAHHADDPVLDQWTGRHLDAARLDELVGPVSELVGPVEERNPDVDVEQGTHAVARRLRCLRVPSGHEHAVV